MIHPTITSKRVNFSKDVQFKHNLSVNDKHSTGCVQLPLNNIEQKHFFASSIFSEAHSMMYDDLKTRVTLNLTELLQSPSEKRGSVCMYWTTYDSPIESIIRFSIKLKQNNNNNNIHLAFVIEAIGARIVFRQTRASFLQQLIPRATVLTGYSIICRLLLSCVSNAPQSCLWTNTLLSQSDVTWEADKNTLNNTFSMSYCMCCHNYIT